MRQARNRMATPITRESVPAERVIVQPPPESVLKCPHCGSARRNGMRVPGSHPRRSGHRRECTSCGARLLFSDDFARVRIVG